MKDGANRGKESGKHQMSLPLNTISEVLVGEEEDSAKCLH